MKKPTTSRVDKHALQIGRDIRAIRKNRGQTLSEIAVLADCSVGYLSEVERGERMISIKILSRIAGVFDRPIGWFFTHDGQPENERGVIVRANNRKRIGSGEDGLVEELLSPDLSGSFEMFKTRIDPGSRSNGQISRGLEEEGLILSGTLSVKIDGDEFQLKAGDSFRVNKKRFSWQNNGRDRTDIIWVTSPPVY